MKPLNYTHRGYTAYSEFDTVIWYRTTKSAQIGTSSKTGARVMHPIRMNRVVTNTDDLDEAIIQLDRYLIRPGPPKDASVDNNYKLDL